MKEKLLAIVALAAVLAVPTTFAESAERLAALRTKGIEERLSLDELHEVRELLRPLAEAGDAEAQIGLANSYFRTEIGRESKYLKDETPPVKELSYTDYYFDYYYPTSRGTNSVEVMEDQNLVEARKWYRRAAEAGSPRAMLFLSLTLAGGSSRPPNDRTSPEDVLKPGTESRRWLEKAAQNGSALACFVLFEKGEKILPDEERLHWLRKGANLGSPGLQMGLAFVYSEGYLGLPQDQSECLKWLRKAAESGFRKARKKMPSMCLEAGQYEEAEMWFDKLGDGKSSYFAERAMKKCSAEGKTSHVLQWALRLDALYDDEKVKQTASPSDSRRSESRRAERAKVQHAIATIYHWGAREQGTDGEWADTVKANAAEAMKWYRKAAENGDYESIFALCEYYADNKNFAEAVKWLKRGEKIEGEHQGRMKYMLFECLLFRDNRMGHEANRLLEEAAKLGDSQAVEALKLRDDTMNSRRRRK